MDNKQVSFAKHVLFYKKFFENHKKILINFISLDLSNIDKGKTYLFSFYSSYSYYLTLELKEEVLRLNQENKEIYQKLLIKSNNGKNTNNLTIDEYTQLNNIYFTKLISIFELFKQFLETLSPDDILPNLTESSTDYDKNVLFASYETFYENLFNMHSIISDDLAEFTISSFNTTFLKLLAFFYGHSYYVNRKTIIEIESLIYESWTLFSKKETLILFVKEINGEINLKELNRLKEIQQSLFINLSNIFSLINVDLSSKNLMPKKKEKVTVDMTLI